MFKFLFGVAFGAAAYWAWQSFGRDLVGMGSDQETSYGGFNGASTSSTYGGTGTSSASSTSPSADPTTSASGTSGAAGSSA
jgi:hypothetical protein